MMKKNNNLVDKNKQIRLNEETLFEFDCQVEDEYLYLKLNEIDALSPYIYIKKIDLKELQNDVHKMFKALDTLDEVKQHILQFLILPELQVQRRVLGLSLRPVMDILSGFVKTVRRCLPAVVFR